MEKRMMAMKCQVKDLDDKSKGEIELKDSVFAVEPRKDLLARTVNWQLAKRRSGTHKVKLVGDISGTTAKPFRQRAQVGPDGVARERLSFGEGQQCTVLL